MPITCPIKIDSVSTEDFGKLDYAVMGHMFAVQNEIGRLADERVYQADVSQRLSAGGMPSHVEVPIELAHKSFVKELFLDLVVSRKAVYELKTVAALNSNHVAQMLSYLYLLDLPRGKLVNFRSATVESEFVNAPISPNKRRGFSVSDDGFRGDRDLPGLMVDLLRDWGTCLSVSLYHQALVHMLGGRDTVGRMLPLTRDGRELANQRFHLVNDDHAFELTALSKLDHDHHGHLQRLLEMSPLQTIHWINIGPHRVTFQTVART